MQVRKGAAADMPEIRRIQRESPQAAQWDVAEYSLLVVECEGSIAGFLAWRTTAPDEAEILNLAVDRRFRRRGAALALIGALQVENVFLEVREGNVAARSLYGKAGFVEAGIRFGYYSQPLESGIVMRLQS